jgi:hypothetical protein
LKSRIFIYIAIASLGVGSCKRIADPIPTGTSFYPLAIDKYITYQITEKKHYSFQERTDSNTYWQKEHIEKQLIDNAGNTTFKLGIYTSTDSGKTFKFSHYGVLWSDKYSSQRYENDIRKVVLSFPLKERKTWDANELNSLEYQRARMTNVHKSFTTSSSKTFAKSLTIDLGDEEDPFFRILEKEIYADSIGLIQREYINIETQPGKYKNGNEYIKTIYATNW